MAKVSVIKDSQLQELDDKDVDIEIPSFSNLVGTHANVVPMMNNAQSARLFYASRFVDQAMPLKNRETPLVQSLDPQSADGKSFEDTYGSRVGARYANDDGEVVSVDPDEIVIKTADGQQKHVNLYNNFQFNRKTSLTNKAVVKPGDKVKKGQILAGSNFTDDNGTLSMGVNARVAMVPYKGFSMDDAIVVSDSFAKKLASEHSYAHDMDKDQDTKTGKSHYSSLFPTKFTKEQLENLDDDGVVKPGTILKKGDPIMLATRPKPVYSNATHLGKLGKTFRSIRGDAAQVWEHDYPGTVADVSIGKKKNKVFINAVSPLVPGDKIIMRNGQKGILSKVIPDDQMLRSLDGTPFEVLLNPLALPSRVNTATLYELALGKVAQKEGKPIKVPGFMKRGESRLDYVMDRLAKAGLSDTEEVFDPTSNRKLDKPITTGVGYIEKLHHVVDSKMSARGQGSYDQNMQPLKGGSDAAQAKRLGGLESTALLAKGGYATLREGSTLRGQKNDEYWRQLRQGYKPAEPGTPFVFDKFKVLLNGAGMNAKDLGKGQLRLGPMTDKDLDANNPVEIKNGKLVDSASLEGIADGLFDEKVVALNKWGKILLPHKMPNPAFEKQICQMLGITGADMRRVMAGEMDLEEAQNGKTRK